MPTQSSISRANANPARVGKVSAPTPSGDGVAAEGMSQVNASGNPFWQLGSPQCAGKDVRVYPDLED